METNKPKKGLKEKRKGGNLLGNGSRGGVEKQDCLSLEESGRKRGGSMTVGKICLKNCGDEN